VRKQAPKDHHFQDEHELNRIIIALSKDGAYGIEVEYEKGIQSFIAIVAACKGVSVRVARTYAGIAEALCRADLGRWEITRKSSKRRLVLTPEGHAKSVRLQTEDESQSFRMQHHDIEMRDVLINNQNNKVLVNISESPLAWLAARRGRKGQPLVEESSLAAGERLRAEVERAHMMPRVTAQWNAAVSSSRRGSGDLDFSEASVAARQRVMAALRFVGPDFADVLLDVCAFLKGLEQIERERNWPQRSAKVVLKMALARLAVHYGYSTQAIGLSHSLGIQHWGAADFKPSLEAEGASS
jgi:Domain of unknown function (DUF6456)